MKEKLELQIQKLIEKYQNAKSLPLRGYYYNGIYSLIDVYQDLTKEAYPFYPRITDIVYHTHQEKKKFKTLFSMLSTPQYRDMIGQLSSNGITIIEDNMQLSEEEFDITINFKTACEIIYNFFEKYDSKVLPVVKYILENEVVFCPPELEKLGYSINVQPLRKTYIVSFLDKDCINIESLITLIHELGHVLYIKDLIVHQKQSKYNNFLEVLPHLFEQIFIDFCFKNNIYSLECLKVQKNNIKSLYNYLIELEIVNRFINKIRLKTLSLKLNYKQLNQIPNFDFNCNTCTFEECDLNYQYSYGILLGFYYYNLYKQDPEKVQEYIRKFILDVDSFDDLYILKNYGIDYDEFISCEFLKSNIEENQKRINKTTQN